MAASPVSTSQLVRSRKSDYERNLIPIVATLYPRSTNASRRLTLAVALLASLGFIAAILCMSLTMLHRYYGLRVGNISLFSFGFPFDDDVIDEDWLKANIKARKPQPEVQTTTEKNTLALDFEQRQADVSDNNSAANTKPDNENDDDSDDENGSPLPTDQRLFDVNRLERDHNDAISNYVDAKRSNDDGNQLLHGLPDVAASAAGDFDERQIGVDDVIRDVNSFGRHSDIQRPNKPDDRESSDTMSPAARGSADALPSRSLAQRKYERGVAIGDSSPFQTTKNDEKRPTDGIEARRPLPRYDHDRRGLHHKRKATSTPLRVRSAVATGASPYDDRHRRRNDDVGNGRESFADRPRDLPETKDDAEDNERVYRVTSRPADQKRVGPMNSARRQQIRAQTSVERGRIPVAIDVHKKKIRLHDNDSIRSGSGPSKLLDRDSSSDVDSRHELASESLKDDGQPTMASGRSRKPAFAAKNAATLPRLRTTGDVASSLRDELEAVSKSVRKSASTARRYDLLIPDDVVIASTTSRPVNVATRHRLHKMQKSVDAHRGRERRQATGPFLQDRQQAALKNLVQSAMSYNEANARHLSQKELEDLLGKYGVSTAGPTAPMEASWRVELNAEQKGFVIAVVAVAVLVALGTLIFACVWCLLDQDGLCPCCCATPRDTFSPQKWWMEALAQRVENLEAGRPLVAHPDRGLSPSPVGALSAPVSAPSSPYSSPRHDDSLHPTSLDHHAFGGLPHPVHHTPSPHGDHERHHVEPFHAGAYHHSADHVGLLHPTSRGHHVPRHPTDPLLAHGVPPYDHHLMIAHHTMDNSLHRKR